MEKQPLQEAVIQQETVTVHEKQDDRMDLVALFYLMWEHILQIVVCILVGGAVAFIYTYLLVTPMYRATAKMYVASATYNSIVDIYDLQLGTQLALDYQQLILSRPLLEDVIDALDLDLEPEMLESMVSVGNPEETRILTITVTCADPQLAADLANEIADQAGIHLPRIMECPAPNIYEEALVPERKFSPSYTRNTLLGALLFMVVDCSVLVIRYLMNDSFTTPEDISRCFGVQPLAVIPEGDFKNKKSKHSYENIQKNMKTDSASSKT